MVKAIAWRIRRLTERRLSINVAYKVILIANFPNLVVLKSDRAARLIQRSI